MTLTRVETITSYFKLVSDKTVWSFVRVQSACGLVGWGEATVNGKARELDQEVTRQHARLSGTDVDVMQPIAPINFSKCGWAVVSAIDQALWDIMAQREGKSLRDMLGGSRRNDVAIYANINRGTLDRSPEGFAATAAAAASAGFEAIKIAPFDDLTPGIATTAAGASLISAGMDRIAATHAAIRGRARLQVDCHWRFTPQTATSVLREATQIGITWFECPLPETADNIPAIRRLRGIANDGGVQLAGLEENSTLTNFLPWLEVYDVMMPDVKYAGGLTELFRIVDTLRDNGVDVSLHNPTGSVCHATSLHVTAAMPEGLPLEMQWGETDLLFDLPMVPLTRPSGGRSLLPSGSGHGAGLDIADLASAPP